MLLTPGILNAFWTEDFIKVIEIGWSGRNKDNLPDVFGSQIFWGLVYEKRRKL